MFNFIHNIRKKFSKTYREKMRREELEGKMRDAGLRHHSAEYVRAIIDSLKELRADAAAGKELRNEFHGICLNVQKYTALREDLRRLNTVKVVCNFAYGWRHHNGNHSYPVPEDVDYGAWEGPNLVLRLSLIDYVISELEAAYANEELA